jgi:NitT/TauT family transport system permease protein
MWRLQWRYFVPFFTPVVVLLLWQLLVSVRLYPEFLIPSPLSVAQKFAQVWQDGTWQLHTLTTLQEMLIGLLWGVSIGVMLGYVIAKFPIVETILSPIIVAFQATPIVAYAPLLVVWFGTGLTSKYVTCAIIVFFPTLLNTIVGIRNVPQDWRDLMRSLNASWLETFIKLELPSAMPVFLTGLKTSATLALIGAVVGEFVSARSGLGFWVNLARNQYDTPLVFVVVFTMTSLALGLYGTVMVLERVLLRWQKPVE